MKLNPRKRKPGTTRAEKGEAVRDLNKGRICSGPCKTYKSRNNFYENPFGFNGLGVYCKDCIKKINKSPQHKAARKAIYDNKKIIKNV